MGDTQTDRHTDTQNLWNLEVLTHLKRPWYENLKIHQWLERGPQMPVGVWERVYREVTLNIEILKMGTKS